MSDTNQNSSQGQQQDSGPQFSRPRNQKIINENECTFCEKEFEDSELLVDVTLSVNTYRISNSGVRENIENASMHAREILCDSCFEAFAKTLDQINIERQKVKGNVSE